jgi:hypothetical protein
MPVRRSRAAHGANERLGLEAVASEFAMLAQRRGRLERQIALLARQAEAAVANLGRVERRMLALSARMKLPEGQVPLPKAIPRRVARGALLEY